MRITACELPNDGRRLDAAWDALAAHTARERSDLVVLPEMPFSPWLASLDAVDPEAWEAAVREHERRLGTLGDLGAAAVVSTRPVVEGGRRYNQGFVWDRAGGVRDVHRKRFLPDEAGFHEARWYDRGPASFETVEVAGIRLAFAICTEIWFHAPFRGYVAAGVHVLACPRATRRPSIDKWLAGGRAAAVVTGAHAVSSNLAGPAADDLAPWGGHGWIVEPEEGEVLATTSQDTPFRTVEIDPAAADAAKRTYPRYVRD